MGKLGNYIIFPMLDNVLLTIFYTAFVFATRKAKIMYYSTVYTENTLSTVMISYQMTFLSYHNI